MQYIEHNVGIPLKVDRDGKPIVIDDKPLCPIGWLNHWLFSIQIAGSSQKPMLLNHWLLAICMLHIACDEP